MVKTVPNSATRRIWRRCNSASIALTMSISGNFTRGRSWPMQICGMTAGSRRKHPAPAGSRGVELGVFANNVRACRLYEKMGFIVEGVRSKRVKVDGRYRDEVLMALQL